jgi:predicted nuclease of predicted toxin-antitoxin system
VKFLFDHDVPDDLAYAVRAAGHEVELLRAILPTTTADAEVLRIAGERGEVLVTCNRDDFVTAAMQTAHRGIIVVIRRRSRALERAALIRLLDNAGDSGIRNNINFA